MPSFRERERETNAMSQFSRLYPEEGRCICSLQGSMLFKLAWDVGCLDTFGLRSATYVWYPGPGAT